MSLTPHLLALAATPVGIGSLGKRTRFIFRVATLPALAGILLVMPFRVPRETIEALALPIIGAVAGIGWIQAGAWRVADVRWREIRPARSIWPALAALILLLLIFQFVLWPGVPSQESGKGAGANRAHAPLPLSASAGFPRSFS